MKTHILLIASIVLCLLTGCQKQIMSFETDTFKLDIDSNGNISSLLDKTNNKEYLALGQQSPLLAIRINGEYETPANASWNESSGIFTLSYPKNQTTVLIQSNREKKFITFEVQEVRSDKKIDLVVWGPYPTTIAQTIGECVGVVRDSIFALGIQALNPKTMGGYPTTEDDIDPSFDIFSTTSLVDVSDSTKVLYRGQTAKHTDFGSMLQAYCRNRDHERIIPMWKHTHYTAPAYNDKGFIGSKIAIFGCPVDKILDHIEEIELTENLPHPEINGVWMKQAPEATQAYIIYPFNEKNIDEAIAFTRRTGLKYLYHGGPFQTWGHFKLNPDEFPNGWKGLKTCVEKAKLFDIKLGVHTLSNFITTNDALVTPIPSKHLAKVGSSTLVANIDANTTEIEIKDPTFFNQMENNSLHTVLVGNELIRYEKVSDTAPWILQNCQRGAWNTTASTHAQNDTISKLMDHGYKTFLTDIELTKEVARTIADLFNQTGIQQISFDGLEGAWSTGLGQYGLSLMIKEWYDHLSPENKNCINDASMTTHYNWHTFTRMNWGEPWYAGFRESQMNYRLMNQDFYRRNLIPCMLGWFKLDANTGIEDMEWLLARSAAFDAGYTLVTNKEAITQNGYSDQIIEAIRIWEKARLSGAFPKRLKKEMEHTDREYTLKENSINSWDLYPYSLQRFSHANVIRQPGEPVCSKWIFNNPNPNQPLIFLIRANDPIKNISIEINNHTTIKIDETLQVDETLKFDGEEQFIIYDRNWNIRKTIPAKASDLIIPTGDIQLLFACDFNTPDNPEKRVNVELKTLGEKISLKAVH